jgi:hypothetical protein
MTDAPQDQPERRDFPRVPYRAYATLTTTSHQYPVHIVDLSFNGALAALIEPHGLTAGDDVTLNIDLEEGVPIKMMGTLAHQEQHYLGVECHSISTETQSRLRALLKEQHDEMSKR